jgi:hypothetical protein
MPIAELPLISIESGKQTRESLEELLALSSGWSQNACYKETFAA